MRGALLSFILSKETESGRPSRSDNEALGTSLLSCRVKSSDWLWIRDIFVVSGERTCPGFGYTIFVMSGETPCYSNACKYWHFRITIKRLLISANFQHQSR